MACILGIGIATLDIINEVDGYPAEDSEVRAVAQRIMRGGNCTNTLAVLSQLGHTCAWGGVLADEPDARPIVADLDRHRIDQRAVRTCKDGKVPASYIALNRRSGSRTIIHYRDLPEFTFDDFQRIDLGNYHWMHCEGRNIDETRLILAHARVCMPALPRSVEIEKPRPKIEALFDEAEVLLFSRHYAQSRDYTDPALFLADIHRSHPRAIKVLAWGTEGACGIGHDGRLYRSYAYPPLQIIDTLGAGDTFNAGIIDALLRKRSLEEALHDACKLAGCKCGHEGLNFL